MEYKKINRKKILGQAEIRDRAVEFVRRWYKRHGWRIVVQKRKPYDLVANKGTNRRYIEVKGTMNQRTNFRALLTRNEKKFIEQCLMNKTHYRFHVVAGLGRFDKQIHRVFTANKIPKPKSAGHYYITVPMKKGPIHKTR